MRGPKTFKAVFHRYRALKALVTLIIKIAYCNQRQALKPNTYMDSDNSPTDQTGTEKNKTREYICSNCEWNVYTDTNLD